MNNPDLPFSEPLPPVPQPRPRKPRAAKLPRGAQRVNPLWGSAYVGQPSGSDGYRTVYDANGRKLGRAGNGAGVRWLMAMSRNS
jgi:hypothetical protein